MQTCFQVYCLADPPAMGYIVRRPIHGQNFAAADYTSLQAVLNDIEVIIRETLRSSFEILPRDYHVGERATVLAPSSSDTFP